MTKEMTKKITKEKKEEFILSILSILRQGNCRNIGCSMCPFYSLKREDFSMSKEGCTLSYLRCLKAEDSFSILKKACISKLSSLLGEEEAFIFLLENML